MELAEIISRLLRRFNMAWWLPLALGAGAGLLKNELVDKPQNEAMQAAEAEKTKWSPWTGMKGQTLKPPSAFGSMLQGGATGAMIGQMGGKDPSKGIAMNTPNATNQSIYQNIFDMNKSNSAIG